MSTVMLNAGTAESCATILSRVTMRRRTMRAEFYVCLTMALDRRLVRVNLHISLPTNVKILLVLCLEAMLVSIAMWFPVFQNQVGHQATFGQLNSRDLHRFLRITQAMSLSSANRHLAAPLFTSA